jgi:glycosyltransferase involved in cell wall biosynthesis
MNSAHDLTIVTIGLNNDYSLEKTYDSIKEVLKLGAKWCVVLSEISSESDYLKSAHLISGKDSGLYNALNIGIDNVKTKYFMFIHSGDMLINVGAFKKSFQLFEKFELDLVLGGARLGSRTHLSKRWKPWMFKVLVQPPHLPIIYRRSFVSSVRFDETIPIISDFFMLQRLFEYNPKYVHSKEVYISMALGGKTTSGISSFFLVSKEFYQFNNSLIKTMLLSLIRLLLKVVLK